MSEAIKYQLELTRNNLLREVKNIPQDLLDVQPEGFNNTIHWHIGHVLTVTEQFIMNYPNNTDHLSENYLQLFGYGTKPSDWTGEVPSVNFLIDQLQDQIVRINKIPNDVFNQELPEAILGQKTVGQLAMLSAYHEANHLGQIHAMKRIVEK
ncbi:MULTISPECIES: DinB family protein [Cytobacillus]|uniref:Formate dehydrogenase n=1 Tax=Cytobacillus kochii TaxID=859143 RepID=A0A248TEN6_9BACI|nr:MULTISPECIES: DinB family protein [Cytobacillus]ASV66671.1 formate dehydrogenase [Cytobacillus kochii]MDQ0187643.1 putative damage-inducible protein DinB [Cytobacillus kochii]MEA1854179.1 DinB family protein [Cytobacillus sp. OWB-43]MED1607202.1 DinB family protein [Cytobacillus kochii]